MFLVCFTTACQNGGVLTYEKEGENCVCDCPGEFTGEFCQNLIKNVIDRCDVFKLNQCEQIHGSFQGEEKYESATMKNANNTDGDIGTYNRAKDVFENTNTTFSFDEIIHYNSKITSTKFSNILISGMSSFNSNTSEHVSYRIINGNITIFCEELIFSKGSAELFSTVSRTTKINDTFYVISNAYGSFAFFNMPLKAYKGYIYISEAEVDYNGLLYKNISNTIKFDSFLFTLESRMSFENATYFVNYLNFSPAITGTSFRFESGAFNATII
jgi:hypothetical protein